MWDYLVIKFQPGISSLVRDVYLEHSYQMEIEVGGSSLNSCGSW